MADQKKPNILVIWGDDIGISNLSCYSHGLMGYQTPNIDRLAKEGMMFTDCYGEQSCTAGRSSFITGQSVYRTGLSKVGIPGAPIGMTEKIVTIAGAAQEPGLRDRAVRQEPSRRSQPHAADQPRLRRVLRQPLSPQRRGRAGDVRLSARRRISRTSARTSARAACIHSWATDKDDPTEEPRWGKVGKQKIEDTGPLTKKRMETCDDEFVAAAKDFIKRQNEDGKPFFVWLNTTHMHLFTHTKKESLGQAGPLAVAVSRHDDRPRQERRRDARLSRRARHRRRHLRHVFDRQRPAPQLLAGWRHDAVPQREEHQLGRRVPHPDAGALAGQDQGRARSRTRSSSITTGCRPSSPWPAIPTSSTSSRRATRRSAAPTRTTSTATTCCPT